MAEPTRPTVASPTTPLPVAGALPSMLLLAAEDTPRLASRLDAWVDQPDRDRRQQASSFEVPDDGPARLAIVGLTPRRLELARKVLAQDLPWRGRNSVWFEPQGLLRDGGRLAFVFPGVEPDFEPKIDDVVHHLGLEPLAAGPHRDPAVDMPDLERQTREIVAVARVLHRALGHLGIAPDMVAGHSIGEWTGKLAAGVVSEGGVDTLVAQVQPGTADVADVAYLALGCDAGTARELAEGLDRTVVSHDNCPQQSVLCGPVDQIEVAAFRSRARQVLAQELPFRSGFHSPLFAAPSPEVRDAFESVPLRAPAVSLWSATTCQPFPPAAEDIRALAWRHLVEPVRFRELVLALHQADARVFVQVGVGHLTAFIESTLRGRDMVAVEANTAKRSGLEQLCQVAAAVWVAGRDVALERLAVPARGADPVTTRHEPPRVTSPPPGDTELVWQERFSLEDEPAWADHALVRQPDHWPHPEDRFPLVPMAGIVEILTRSAARLHPHLVPVVVEDMSAFRYLTVAPPTVATLRAWTLDGGRDGPTRVRVAIDRHAQATVLMAQSYPTALRASGATGLEGELSNHVEAEHLYADRYLFHGPAYQGIEEILALAENGSRARLRTTGAPGALLDSAAQLTGHWLSAKADTGRVMLPTSIRQVELFGPHPPPGTPVDCTTVVTHLDDQILRADMVLVADDRLWCRVTGWENRRYAIDAAAFQTLRWPEQTPISIRRTGYTLAAERWPDAASRDVIMRCYLGRDEHHEYDRHTPLNQRPFLLGRIALKDAVRRWLWDQGHGPLYPAEIAVANDSAGRPLVRGPYPEDLRVSLSHVDGVAVAQVAERREVGIDIEKVAPRRSDFERLVLTQHEQRIEPPEELDRDAWLTALWAVKEAAASAAGRDLAGRPKDFEIAEWHPHEDGWRCRVGDRWIALDLVNEIKAAASGTSRKEHIVAWTLFDH